MIGFAGIVWLSDVIAGYTKAERMGRVRYSNTPQKRKKKWLLVLIFLGVFGVGALLKWLGGGIE